MKQLKEISPYIVISIIICTFCKLLESDFLLKYLTKNIISLLLTLLAINIATLGLIASKIQDMLDNHPKMSFKTTTNEMRLSLKEQVVLIFISIFFLIIFHSTVIVWEYKDFILNTVLVSVLLYSIHILWDTGNAVFVIIDLIEEQNKET